MKPACLAGQDDLLTKREVHAKAGYTSGKTISNGTLIPGQVQKSDYPGMGHN